jgi:DegV family protein with EDD domain
LVDVIPNMGDKMVNILTDSTCDLSPEIAAEFGLTVIPLSVTLGGEVYRDGVDISQKELFGLIEKHGELPKTSAPPIGEFMKAFDQFGESLFIGISSKLSTTIQNALLAASSLPSGRVRVVDSLNLSTGVGLLAIRAAELRDQSLSLEQIEEKLLASVLKVRTSFVIDTMEYLYKGGRCTALQAIAGSVLKIHPIIEVNRDGTLGVKEKARGTLQKGHQMMLEDFKSHLSELDRRRVFVTHSFEREEDAQFLVDEVKRIAAPAEVRITCAGSVISSHCGPRTAGILYFVA